MADLLRTNIDFGKNFIRGAARLMICDLTTAFPINLSDSIRMTTGSNVSEVQTVTITGTPTAGTFTLTFKGYTTSAIAFNATAATVQTALNLLASIGATGVVVTGGPGPATPYVVTFANQLANQNVPIITANISLLTGGTPAATVVETTMGIGLYDAMPGWQDLGATKGGITVSRNNAEETFDVDQILADILAQPSSWTQQVSASVAQADIDTLQYLWEGGTITVNGTTGERTLPLGAPTSYRQKRLIVLFQRQSTDGGITAGNIRAYCFRVTHRTPQDSSIVHNKTGDQATVAFTWACMADPTVVDPYARFGSIIDQAPA